MSRNIWAHGALAVIQQMCYSTHLVDGPDVLLEKDFFPHLVNQG